MISRSQYFNNVNGCCNTLVIFLKIDRKNIKEKTLRPCISIQFVLKYASFVCYLILFSFALNLNYLMRVYDKHIVELLINSFASDDRSMLLLNWLSITNLTLLVFV